MRVNYPHDGLNIFWHRLCCEDYTRSMPTLFRVMRRLGLYRAKPQNPKYVPKPYEPAHFPGQKVQIDVKVVPSSCINFINTQQQMNSWSELFLSRYAKCRRTTALSSQKDFREQSGQIKLYLKHSLRLTISNIKEYALTAKQRCRIGRITNTSTH